MSGRRRAAVIAGAIASLALVAAPCASAATEVGSNCIGNGVSNKDFVLIQLGNASSPLPVTTPAGVVTKWMVASSLGGGIKQQLVVARPTGAPNEFRVAGVSTEQTVVAGLKAFDTRIPVQQGDHLGLHGDAENPAIYCTGLTSADTLGVAGGGFIGGAPSVLNPAPETQAAVSAIVEPDADGDGYGDETQDKCAQNAATQGPCPIALDSLAIVGDGAITLLVIADHEAPVTVTAIEQSGKGAKKRLARKTGRLKLSGGTHTVTPGKIAKFKIKFTKALKFALGKLSKGKSLKMAVTATATNSAGQSSAFTTVVKLKRNAAGG